MERRLLGGETLFIWLLFYLLISSENNSEITILIRREASALTALRPLASSRAPVPAPIRA